MDEEKVEFNLARFVLLLFVLLAVCFTLWWAISAQLAQPAISVANSVLDSIFPNIFYKLEAKGADAMVFSAFGELNGQLVPARQAGHALAFQFNTQILSYSLPFFFALTVATPGSFSLENLIMGWLFLYIIFCLCVVVVAVKTLMLGIGIARFNEFVNSGFLNADVVALSYQLCTLIIPVLSPVLIWAAQNRKKLDGLVQGQKVA